MRIALVAPHGTRPSQHEIPSRGPHMMSLARAVAGLGHDVTVYARKDSPRLPGHEAGGAPGVSIENLPAGPAAPLSEDDIGPHVRAFSDELARRWRQCPPDVAHAHFWPGGLAALAGGRDLGVPVVQTFHSAGAGRPGHTPVRTDRSSQIRLKVSLARTVNAVLAGSSGEMSELAGLGVPRRSIRVVPSGVDTERFSPEGPATRRSGRPRLLAVAPLEEEQGLDVVIRALAEVPEAELVIAGGPARRKLGQHDVCQALTRLAGDLGVMTRVFFAGSVSSGELPALLRSADLLVSAAWDEPFGVVALQAMACGTPVVASAVGCHPDVVIDGTTGMLVPPGEPAMLGRRIRRVLSSPMLLDAFGIAAADRARARYSWDRIGRETIRAYERCLPCQQAV